MIQGLRVPEVLRKYIPGNPEFIEYTKELPKDSTSQKAKGKSGKADDKAAGAGSKDKAAGGAGGVKAKVDAAVGKVAEKLSDLTSS